jgi:hypothetical protein
MKQYTDHDKKLLDLIDIFGLVVDHVDDKFFRAIPYSLHKDLGGCVIIWRNYTEDKAAEALQIFLIELGRNSLKNDLNNLLEINHN